MSWLFKTLQSDDPGEATSSPASAGSPAGVKEDLSAIGHTIGRQLRGVAAFLAPPPTVAADAPAESETESVALAGLRNDLSEIGGSFKTGLTILSSNGNRAVGGISRFASSFLQFQSKPEEDEEEEEEEENDDGYGGFDDYVPGITDEVLQFVTEISKRPECWTDFPLRLDLEFSMSDAQKEHASTIEQYILDFGLLRQRLCSSLSEEVFWMIYFILLVPRLSGHDSELLSTPEIVEARDILLQKLRNKEPQSETSVNTMPLNTSQDHIQVSKTKEQDNLPLEQDFSKLKVSGKANAVQTLDKPIDDSGNSSAADVRFETEDDISFSDLEDDDSEVSRRLTGNKRAPDIRTSPPNESNDWVQLSESPKAQSGRHKKDSEGEESSDWLNVDDFD